MGRTAFKVFLTASAREDLDEIAVYWAERGDPERGEKYATDLHEVATGELADRVKALGGRVMLGEGANAVREIRVFKRVYRIFYTLDEAAGKVFVLRFWHSHRDEPEL